MGIWKYLQICATFAKTLRNRTWSDDAVEASMHSQARDPMQSVQKSSSRFGTWFRVVWGLSLDWFCSNVERYWAMGYDDLLEPYMITLVFGGFFRCRGRYCGF